MCCGKEEGEISRREETRETEGGMRIVKWAGGRWVVVVRGDGERCRTGLRCLPLICIFYDAS